MLLRPHRGDLGVIGLHIGRVVSALGVTMAVPAAVAAVAGDWNSCSAFVIGGAVALAAGRGAEVRLYTRRPLTWSLGLVLLSLALLVSAAVAAIPLALSGHYAGFLDAMFEAVSGLTTTGLTLVQDLDHLPAAVNVWRHLLQLLGGQATLVVALTLFSTGATPPGTLSVGETRDERIVRNVRRTGRLVLRINSAYLAAGWATLAVVVTVAGASLGDAVLHGFLLTTSGLDTGGFAPRSSSVAYYHSGAVELVLVALMLAGAASVGVHEFARSGRLRELLGSIETRTFALTLGVLTAITMVGLGRAGAFVDVEPLARRGLFMVVSAHTTSGLGVVDGRLIPTDWGLIAPATLVAAMSVGGMAGSTAGGATAWRVGVVLRSVLRDVRRVLLPESALIVTSFRHGRRMLLSDALVRAASTTLLLYLVTYLLGGLLVLGFAGDTPFTEAFFESTAAASNTGLSVGVLDPSAAWPIRLVLLLQMWAGRVEFVSAFALAGFVVAVLRGRS